jgi:hypothetical protein
MSSWDALVYTAATVRPNFRPITGVGVSSSANFSNCLTSSPVQGLPVLRMYFGNLGGKMRLFPSYLDANGIFLA